MGSTTVSAARDEKRSGGFDLLLVLAFFTIYVVWGTTFLAIRIAVAEVPPLLAAGLRFFTAGVLLYGWMRLRGTARPSRTEWRNLLMIGMVMFVAEYGPLFWAEKYVPSGVVSVLAATIPVITVVLEVFVFRRQRFQWSLLWATLLGFCGVGVLLLPDGRERLAMVPCLAILAGGTAWALGSVLNRSLELPKSKPLTAGGSMMLGGAGLLLLSACFGELRPTPHISLRAGLAIAYLIVFGSLLAFTAFVWLLGRMPATRVASHAYVNPVVAVALGYFVGGEAITGRTLAGSALVVVSVFLILRKENVPV